MFPTRTCFDTLELICALWQSERFLCLVRGRKQNSTEEADHCICHHISSMKGRPADCVTHVRECARERGVGGGVYCILPSFLFLCASSLWIMTTRRRYSPVWTTGSSPHYNVPSVVEHSYSVKFPSHVLLTNIMVKGVAAYWCMIRKYQYSFEHFKHSQLWRMKT